MLPSSSPRTGAGSGRRSGLPAEPVLARASARRIAVARRRPRARDGCRWRRDGPCRRRLRRHDRRLPACAAVRPRRAGESASRTRAGVGSRGGVLPAAVRAVGGAPADIVAWLGPAIGPAAYEVGDEVRDALSSAATRAAATLRAQCARPLAGRSLRARRDSLAAAGVEAVYGGGLCTFRESERFFSHRREAPCGRMAALDLAGVLRGWPQ